MRRLQGTRKAQEVAVGGRGEREVGRRRRRIEGIGVVHDLRHPGLHCRRRIVAVAAVLASSRERTLRNERNPFGAPVKRADNAIGRDVGETTFPGVEDCLKHLSSCYTARLMRFTTDTIKRMGRKRAPASNVSETA